MTAKTKQLDDLGIELDEDVAKVLAEPRTEVLFKVLDYREKRKQKEQETQQQEEQKKKPKTSIWD